MIFGRTPRKLSLASVGGEMDFFVKENTADFQEFENIQEFEIFLFRFILNILIRIETAGY